MSGCPKGQWASAGVGRWSGLGERLPWSSTCPASRWPLQLEKVYDPKNEEDDMREMEEERLRMREHVMKNVRGPGPGVGGGRGRGPSSVTDPSRAPRWTPTRTAS